MNLGQKIQKLTRQMGARVAGGGPGGGAGMDADLRALARGVEEMNRAADTEFLELSRSLKSLYGTATKLAGEIGAQAATMRESLERGRLNGAEGAASLVLGELERSFGEVAGNWSL